ncbi:guanine deaminase [Glaciihabitans tibetensis]|uniref:Guanine deaminase n=2 Tax=Glaciihabitans tibetensis TaxID=1266600 RepID=A0A2T0VFU6_9MICO|nr:guanine deaminase [Glaciihabitans tibetensis]
MTPTSVPTGATTPDAGMEADLEVAAAAAARLAGDAADRLETAGPSARAAARAAADADARWLARAIELATENVANGGGPFGAVIVRDGELVAEGQNRVTASLDPTAHAEVSAIRAACQAVGDFSLAGMTLYTSCEPCPLCVSASLWARLDRVVFAANRDDAARGGFDDSEFYELFARDRATWPMQIEVARPSNATEPFDAWLALEARTDY